MKIYKRYLLVLVVGLILLSTVRSDWKTQNISEKVKQKVDDLVKAIKHLPDVDWPRFREMKKSLSHYASKAGDLGTEVGHIVIYKLKGTAEGIYASLCIGVDKFKNFEIVQGLRLGDSVSELLNKCKVAYDKSKEAVNSSYEVGKDFAGKAYGKGKKKVGEMAEKTSEYADKVYEKGQEITNEVLEKSKEYASKAYEKGKEMASKMKDKTKEYADKAYEKGSKKAAEMAEKASEYANKAYQQGQEITKEVLEKSKEYASKAYEKGKEIASEMKDKTKEYAEKACEKGAEVTEELTVEGSNFASFAFDKSKELANQAFEIGKQWSTMALDALLEKLDSYVAEGKVLAEKYYEEAMNEIMEEERKLAEMAKKSAKEKHEAITELEAKKKAAAKEKESEKARLKQKKESGSLYFKEAKDIIKEIMDDELLREKVMYREAIGKVERQLKKLKRNLKKLLAGNEHQVTKDKMEEKEDTKKADLDQTHQQLRAEGKVVPGDFYNQNSEHPSQEGGAVTKSIEEI